jgi:hypothetical protein
MLGAGTVLLVAAGWAAVPLVVWLVVRASGRAAQAPLPRRCEAWGGPCDGRVWMLPESAPVWLRQDGSRHLYRPDATDTTGTRYAYAGLSEPAVSVA